MQLGRPSRRHYLLRLPLRLALLLGRLLGLLLRHVYLPLEVSNLVVPSLSQARIPTSPLRNRREYGTLTGRESREDRRFGNFFLNRRPPPVLPFSRGRM